jgi:integrase
MAKIKNFYNEETKLKRLLARINNDEETYANLSKKNYDWEQLYKPLHPDNQKLLNDYYKYAITSNLIGKVRLVKNLNTLLKIFQRLDFPFKDLDKETLTNVFAEIKEEYSLKDSTLVDYMKLVKALTRWYNDDKELPKWLKNLPSSYKNVTISEEDLLTDEEYANLISNTYSLRDKLFFSMLHEWGSRSGELRSVQLKNIIINENKTFKCYVHGKTGRRGNLYGFSYNYLIDYLAKEHSDSKNPEAYLFQEPSNHKKPISERTANTALKRTAQRAKITKNVYLHLFRHTCATRLLKEGEPETKVKMWLGWSPNSKMINRYVHLSQSFLDETVLERLGIIEKKDNVTRKSRCVCGNVNSYSSDFCSRCQTPLTKTGYDIQNQKRKNELDKYFEIKKKEMYFNLMNELGSDLVELKKLVKQVKTREKS